MCDVRSDCMHMPSVKQSHNLQATSCGRDCGTSSNRTKSCPLTRHAWRSCWKPTRLAKR